MMKTLIGAAMTATVAMTGIAATPAAAQDRHGYQDRNYGGGGYYQDRDYRGDGYYDQRDYRDARYDRHYRNRRCSSGTTGAIVGGILGALLGREVGRGGRYNRPSGTGTIVGAGAGALVGREIDRGDCRR